MGGLDAILFPPLQPYTSGMADVGYGHSLYWEQCGNPAGKPVVFLHGGPGSGCNPNQRRLFDPRRFRVVLFDQRGSGRSKPPGALAHNSTAHLVEDVERLREMLGIQRWLVFGGSWGSSLAVAYAAAHAESVRGMILRGIFLTGRRDLEWFFQDLRLLLPDAWERLASLAPKRQRRRLLQHYWRRLHGADLDRARAAALAWEGYERAAMTVAGEGANAVPAEEAALLLKYRLQSHYLVRQCFLGERRLLQLAAACRGIPAAILHGRLDRVCPPLNALRLARSIPGARMRYVAGAGHSPFDPPMARALVETLRYFDERGTFSAWGDRP